MDAQRWLAVKVSGLLAPAARADVQLLRARSSAIITGAETVMTDNARLTVRAWSYRSAQNCAT